MSGPLLPIPDTPQSDSTRSDHLDWEGGRFFSVFALFFFLPLSTNHASHAEMFYHHYPNHVCWFGACPLQLQQTIRSHSPLNCSFLLVLALFPPGRIPSSTTRGHLCTRLVMFIVRWVRHTGWSKPNQTKKTRTR